MNHEGRILMKISLLEPIGITNELLEELSEPLKAQGHEFVYYNTKTTDTEELYERAKDSEIVMIGNNPLPDSVISRLDKLKMLDIAFTGIDHIGQKSCLKKRVTVCNAAGYSDETVSELAVGMALSMLRKLNECDKVTHLGGTNASLRGSELGTKTVGIIGTGRIGTKAAKLFMAFGCKVIAYSRTERDKLLRMGVKYTSLEELLEQSDVVSLNVPLTDKTRGLIGKKELERMKKTAILINCARGPVVDNAELAEALNNEVIAGAAIDVFDMEPPLALDYPLMNAKNTLLSPHVAFLSDESMVRRAHIVFENINAYLEGNPKNVIKIMK